MLPQNRYLPRPEFLQYEPPRSQQFVGSSTFPGLSVGVGSRILGIYPSKQITEIKSRVRPGMTSEEIEKLKSDVRLGMPEEKKKYARSENIRAMIDQMTAVRRLFKTGTGESVNFFTFLKKFFNANCDKSNSTEEERKELNAIAAEYETKYPIAKGLFATILGPGWKTEECASLRDFPIDTLATNLPSFIPFVYEPPPSSTPVPYIPKPNGFDSWW